MKLVFSIHNLEVNIPVSPAKKPDDPIIHMNDSCRPYLLLGLNEWFDNTRLRRVFFDPKASKILGPTRYTLEGTLPVKDEEHMAHFFMGGLLVSLMIPIASKGYRVCMQRHAKCVIAWTDWLLEGRTKFHVSLHNKWYKDEILCKFDVQIAHLDAPKTLYDRLNNSKISPSDLRCKMYKDLQEEMVAQRNNLLDVHLKLKCENEDDERKSLYASHNFFGDRPINSWLNARLRGSNEKYWQHLFDVAMLLKRTEMGLDDCTNEEAFWKLNVNEQMDILGDMLYMPSVHSTYLRDLVLRGDGTLSTEKADDFSENIDEGGVDCEDKEKGGKKMDQEFQHVDYTFTNPCLEELRKRRFRYVKGSFLADLNTSAPGHEIKTELHITGSLIHKSLFFQLVKIHPTGSIVYGDQNWKRIEEDLYHLRSTEERAGYLETHVFNGKEKERLPMVLMLEGTQFYYSYPVQFCPPHPSILKKEADYRGWKFPNFKSAQRRNYQTEDFQLLIRYWAFYTDYFTHHPVYAINIPTLIITPATKEGECSWKKGIDVEDLLSYNLSPHERRKLGYDFDVMLCPSSCLRDLKKSRTVMKYTSMDKFGGCPLVMSHGEVESRIEEDTRDIAPNLAPKLRRTIKEFVPKSFRNTYAVTFASNRIFDFQKWVDSKKLSGLLFVEVLPHITIYIAWIEQHEKIKFKK